MIKYETIIKAKEGNDKELLSIINYYSKVIKDYSSDEDFNQIAILNIIQGVKKFKNFFKKSNETTIHFLISCNERFK